MHVEVLFFGMLKDFTGRAGERIEIADGARLETVFERYASEFPRIRQMADSIAMARNQEFAALETPLEEGDEIAFMPPVSGGSEASSEWIGCLQDERGFYAITDRPIDSAALAARLISDSDGAMLTFEGVVRDNTAGRKTRFLDYECYAPLALKTMQQLGRRILAAHDVHGVGIIHRVGRLQIREASVSIVIASAHRQAAYEAGLEAINRLKKTVPVWKKEHFADGEVWVEGDWEDSVLRPAPQPAPPA
jgi:molybdopterin synthase catalytic subunit